MNDFNNGESNSQAHRSQNDQESGRGHGQYRGGHQQNRGGYQQNRGGYQQNRGGYQQNQGGYQQNRGGYQQSRGGYQQSRGGYQQSRGGYQQSRGGYQQNRGDYQQNRGDYQQNRGGNGNGGHQEQSSSSWGNVGSSIQDSTSKGWSDAAATKPAQNQSDWNTSSNSGGWSNVAAKKPAQNDNVSSGWNTHDNKASEQKPTTGDNKWDSASNNATNDWTTATASPNAVDNSWNKAPATQQPTTSWVTTSTPVAPAAPAAVETSSAGGGWDAAPKSATGDWGNMTMDTLGWTNTGKKAEDTVEDGKGIWKNGVHELGIDNEAMRLKLFGTATDQESTHSGINFDKYENIPVETTGENIPEGINQVNHQVPYYRSF